MGSVQALPWLEEWVNGHIWDSLKAPEINKEALAQSLGTAIEALESGGVLSTKFGLS
jgi:hypothetical protein